MVNCRRLNGLRIGELDEDLSTKDYDQGKIDNGKKHARNAYFSDLRNIKKYRKRDVCSLFSEAIKKNQCKGCNMRNFCHQELNCHCEDPGNACGRCVPNPQASIKNSLYKIM